MSRTRELLVSSLTGCVLFVTSAATLGQKSVTMDMIAKAWKDREARARSARFEWMEQETVPKGALSGMYSKLPKNAVPKSFREGGVMPPEDTTHEIRSALCFDGDKVRYERDAHTWSPEKKTYEPRHRVQVFDGEIAKSFLPMGSSSKPWPQAAIKNKIAQRCPIQLCALGLAFRPSAADMVSMNLATMTLTGRKAEINGKSCLEIEQQLNDLIQRVWVDPTRDYVVVRYLSTVNEIPRSRVDVGYRADMSVGWVPDRWDFVNFDGKNKVTGSVRAKLTSYQINPTLESAVFDIDFPPGTVVIDDREGNSQTHIVKEGGAKRKVLPEDRGATYDQIVNSAPGEAHGKRPWSLFSWSVGLMLTVVVAASLLLVWRVWSASRHAA